jgi:hypothetical protein
MTRSEALAWFEARVQVPRGTGSVEGEDRKAYGLAIEALAQPKFVSVQSGDIAVLEVGRQISTELAEKIRDSWRELTGSRAVVVDGGLRLAGVVKTTGPSYEVPAEPLKVGP